MVQFSTVFVSSSTASQDFSSYERCMVSIAGETNLHLTTMECGCQARSLLEMHAVKSCCTSMALLSLISYCF